MDDKLLVKGVLEGDKNAFTTLTRQYQKLVGHMVARLIDDNRSVFFVPFKGDFCFTVIKYFDNSIAAIVV